MTSAADDSAFLTTTEVATHLSWSRDTVLRAIDAGDLPAIRYGRVVRVRRTDLDAFLERIATGDRLAARRRRRSRRTA